VNYQKIYDALMQKARERVTDEYTERHHIVPRCLMGDNSKENIVRLTPEEHYVAHQLLIRIHPNNPKLVYAAMLMTQSNDGTRTNNKLFGWIRRRLAEARRVPHSEERKRKNSEAQKGKKLSAETRAKMSASRKGVPRPEIQKIRCSEAQKGRKKTPEQIEKTRQASLKSWAEMKANDSVPIRPMILCPHCGKEGKNNMRRYHFDNCKNKPKE
jgi:hypothetical protein